MSVENCCNKQHRCVEQFDSINEEKTFQNERTLKGWVYVLTNGKEDGLFVTKVGIAKDVLKRTKQLQTGNARKIEIAHRIPCITHDPFWLERKIHHWLKNNRMRGEWFLLTQEHLAWLQSIDSDCQIYETAPITTLLVATTTCGERYAI